MSNEPVPVEQFFKENYPDLGLEADGLLVTALANWGIDLVGVAPELCLRLIGDGLSMQQKQTRQTQELPAVPQPRKPSGKNGELSTDIIPAIE